MKGFTNAPEDYDGFGTKTLVKNATEDALGLWEERYGLPFPTGGMNAGKPWRFVEVPEAASFNGWQFARYESGSYQWMGTDCDD